MNEKTPKKDPVFNGILYAGIMLSVISVPVVGTYIGRGQMTGEWKPGKQRDAQIEQIERAYAAFDAIDFPTDFDARVEECRAWKAKNLNCSITLEGELTEEAVSLYENLTEKHGQTSLFGRIGSFMEKIDPTPCRIHSKKEHKIWVRYKQADENMQQYGFEAWVGLCKDWREAGYKCDIAFFPTQMFNITDKEKVEALERLAKKYNE